MVNKLSWRSSGFFLCFRMLGTFRVVGMVGGVRFVAADSAGVEDEGGGQEEETNARHGLCMTNVRLLAQ